jgi:hypothetical protein
MSVLSKPRHPTVDLALTLARRWCEGHRIDGAPALTHAVDVAQTLLRYVPDASPELIAAGLLHDSPEFSEPYVESPLDLDSFLEGVFGPEVPVVVRALEREHNAMGDPEQVFCDDRDTLLLSAADKIVSLGSILRRAAGSDDEGAYWEARRPFLDAVPHFRRFFAHAAPVLPADMARELGALVSVAERMR